MTAAEAATGAMQLYVAWAAGVVTVSFVIRAIRAAYRAAQP